MKSSEGYQISNLFRRFREFSSSEKSNLLGETNPSIEELNPSLREIQPFLKVFKLLSEN